MNSNLFPLLKIEILRFLSSFNSKGKKVRKNPIFYFAIVTFIISVLLSCLYSFLMISPFAQEGVDPSPAMGLFAGLTSTLVFMSSMNQARGVYIGEDYDMITSLPIRKRDIVGSKIIAIYLVELLFSIMVMVPHGIMMVIIAHNTTCMLIAFLLAITLPIVPIAIALLISLLVTFATAKFKSANIVFSIAYVIIIVGLSVMSSVMGRLSSSQAVSGFTNVGNVLKWINPTYRFIELSFSSSMLWMIAYIGVNLAVFVGSILFLALLFDKLHAIVSSATMKKTYVRKDLKTKSQAKSLLALEFKRLINSKMYLTNSIMGSLMGIIGSSIMIFSLVQSMGSTKNADAVAVMNLLFIPMFITVSSLIIGLTNPTTGSINIEGKTFWITKTLPIDYKKLMNTKLLFSWALTIPAALIASTIAVIVHHDSPLEIVFTYVIPIVYIILNSLIGLILAIHHPKLKWNNEAEAVKNATSILLGLLIDFLIMLSLGAVMIVFPLMLPGSVNFVYAGVTVAIIIAIIPCAIYLNKTFSKHVRLMEDF